MSGKYPTVIELPKYAHISDNELARDIADTELEIEAYRRIGEAEAAIARSHPSQAERRMADFKSGTRPIQVAERQAFVDFLRRIQQARSTDGTGATGILNRGDAPQETGPA